jgi:hypothetical protein
MRSMKLIGGESDSFVGLSSVISSSTKVSVDAITSKPGFPLITSEVNIDTSSAQLPIVTGSQPESGWPLSLQRIMALCLAKTPSGSKLQLL